MNVSAAIPAVLLDAGYPLLRAQGRADPRAHGGADRAPARGAAAAHRLRALPRRLARPSPTTARLRQASSRASHDRARRCCAASASSSRAPSSPGPCAGMMLGRPRRRRDQGRESGRRSRTAPTRTDSTRRTSRPTTATSAASALDLKQGGDRELFDQLVREADVYIQNFRPGTADRLGAGAEQLQRDQPAARLLLDQRLRRRAARTWTVRATTPSRRR